MSVSTTLGISDITFHLQTHQANIHGYLELMLAEYLHGSDQCLFLPSLISLSECFRCSPVEVHQSLEALRARGCDFFIMGFESPITLWYPTRLDA